MPVGFMSMAGELKRAGYQVKIFNLALSASTDPGFDLRSKLKSIEASVYGVDFHWFAHAYGLTKVVSEIKSLRRNSRVVVGGMSASWFVRDVIKQAGVDAVVIGEGERSLVELVDAWENGKDVSQVKGLAYKVGNKAEFTPLRPPATQEEFSNYDFTSVELIDDYQSYLTFGGKVPNFWLPTARGCPYNCAYCGGSREGYNASMGRQVTIFRDPGSVVRDVETLKQKGVRVVSFTHDPEVGGERYWGPLLRELSSRVPDVGIYIESFRVPSEKFMEALSKLAGSSLAVSPESASQQVRDFVGRHVTDEQIFESLRSAKRLAIPTLIYFLIGLPMETWDTFSLFEPMVKKIIDEKLGFVVPPIPYTLDPNSPMAIRSEEFGVKLLVKTFDQYVKMSKSNEEADWIAHETRWLSRSDIQKMLQKSRQIVLSLYGNPHLEVLRSHRADGSVRFAYIPRRRNFARGRSSRGMFVLPLRSTEKAHHAAGVTFIGNSRAFKRIKTLSRERFRLSYHPVKLVTKACADPYFAEGRDFKRSERKKHEANTQQTEHQAQMGKAKARTISTA
ncbi:MAG: radical SAM protein [Thermoprotei archaeon]